ncbi:MAG: 3-oxoacyl-[acyl-carrier-protein] reductase [Acidobacteria bacterium]|nr:3-oxoacyl-[acyl-carrier-protein] reductase [Acidobacteriota bacterium]
MFPGKVALITGASQGIGREIALTFADQGADLALVDVKFPTLTEVAKEVEKKGVKALPLEVDVSDYEKVKAAVEKVLSEFGKVDILVNNAGITRDNLILRMKPDEWQKVIDVNLSGAFNFTQVVIKAMVKKRYGRIINIASVVGLMGNVGQANYSASKAGLIGFTKSVAREVASRGITVNAIAPGFIDTPMTQALSPEAREKLISQIPTPRLGTPKDIANGVKFLASEEASYITGHVLNISGGLYM